MSSENQNWVLGVTLGLLGSIAINTGNNIQSLGLKALSQEKVEPEPAAVVRQRGSSVASLPSVTWLSPPGRNRVSGRLSLPGLTPPGARTVPSDDVEESEFVVVKVGKRSPAQSVIWVVGTIVFVTGSLLNFASYAFAAQSMLASLESVQFVTNLLFGKFMLGAHVTQTMMAGTCLTVTGTVMAVQFSSKETLDLNTSDIKKLYGNPAYVTYLILMGGAVVVLQIVYRKLNERKKDGRPVKHSDVVLPCVYSVSSALFGTQSVVQAKVLAELLAVHGSGEENIFRSWFTYLTLVIWISTVLVWLKRLNDALKMFNPLFIIPLLQCSFIFFAIISGGIFFREFDAFTVNQWLGFWFGIGVMFSGLVLLTPKPKSAKDDEIHRALVNLLLESRSVVSNMSLEQRTPRSPRPTPREDGADEGNDDAPTEGGRQREGRMPRLSREGVANAALDAVRYALYGDLSARTLMEAMLMNIQTESDRKRRRKALERLLVLIKDNPICSDGYPEEITQLIRELKLDVSPLTPPPGPDIRDVAKHLSMTQERLRHTILLEIESNRSPVPAAKGSSAASPARDLTNSLAVANT
ncbi:hypothetical protein ACHAWF_011908 [Thalassiosira exigua]